MSNRFVTALVQYDDGTGPALYALGDFTMMGALLASGMAKWDGQTWSNVLPPGDRVFGRDRYHVAVADLGDGEAIYMNGNVFFNGQDHVGINKWDGQEWTFIGAPDQLPPPTTPRYVNAITAFDDGRGTAIYIGGLFQSFSGVAARNIVRWDGTNFEPLGSGTVGEVEELTAFVDQRGPALHMCGDVMTGAGGGTLQQRGVLWIGCPNCYANCDLSGAQPRLNVADFICFLNKFAAKDPYANCDGSTAAPALNVADFVCYMGRYAAGCP